MARIPDPIDRFARFLARSEHSRVTIKIHGSDLDAFATWFKDVDGGPMEPAKITPTDLRQLKRWLVSSVGPKPSTASRKLAAF